MKKNLAYFSRVSIVLLGTLGLFLELYTKGLFMLTYYTILSNLLVLGFTGYLLFQMKKDYLDTLDNKVLLRLKGGVTIAILLTFLVYHFMLAPLATPEKYYRLDNFLMHYIVPILFFLDFLFFDKRGMYLKKDPLLWCLPMIAYAIFALVKGYVFQIEIPGQVNSPYPYFFLNVDKLGFLGVFQYTVIILIGYLILGYILYFIKFKRVKK